MRAPRRWLVVGAFVLFVVSCSGSGGGNPTSPTPAAVPPSPSAPAIAGRVSAVARGVAWSPQNGAAVEGVTVEETNSQQSAVTDRNGMFTLPGVSGPFAFFLSKPGYFDKRSTTIPAAATWVELRIDPIAVTHTLTGVVYEIASGVRIPVEGAAIEGSLCDDPTSCKQQLSKSDRNGFYSLTLYEGPNALWVFKEGYQTDPPELPDCDFCSAKVTLDGDTRFDIQLVRP